MSGILGTKLFIEVLLVRNRMTNLFVDSMLMFEDDFYKKEVNGISKWCMWCCWLLPLMWSILEALELDGLQKGEN